jgi:hypothetical protein
MRFDTLLCEDGHKKRLQTSQRHWLTKSGEKQAPEQELDLKLEGNLQEMLMSGTKKLVHIAASRRIREKEKTNPVNVCGKAGHHVLQDLLR